MDKEEDICTLTWEDINRPPSQNLFVWRDAVRHRHAVMTLARQLAFKETGEHARSPLTSRSIRLGS